MTCSEQHLSRFPHFLMFSMLMLLLRVQDQEILAEIFQFWVIVLCSCFDWEILALLQINSGQWELENASKRLKDDTFFFSFSLSWPFLVHPAVFISPWYLHNLVQFVKRRETRRDCNRCLLFYKWEFPQYFSQRERIGFNTLCFASSCGQAFSWKQLLHW